MTMFRCNRCGNTEVNMLRIPGQQARQGTCDDCGKRFTLGAIEGDPDTREFWKEAIIECPACGQQKPYQGIAIHMIEDDGLSLDEEYAHMKAAGYI